MMPVLIQGLRQPGNDIYVYLRPLVDELLQLWGKPGVSVWDEHKQEPFDLRALLFVTINDWPALSNISRQSNRGYNACTHYLDKIKGTHLGKCKKIVYLENHQFLPANHVVRNKVKHFKGEACHQKKPGLPTGKDVLAMVNDLPSVIFGKGPGRQPVLNDADGHALLFQLDIKSSSLI